MDFQELLKTIAKILNEHNIPYAITGGYAVSVWGRVRATFDIDVVVELFERQIPQLAAALRKISAISYIDEGVMKEAIDRSGEFNFIHGDSGIKVDFWVMGKNEFSQIKLKRRIAKDIDGKKVYFLSPEDLILSKLQWYQLTPSSRQLEDVESILAISKAQIDMDYLAKWAERLQVKRHLDDIFARQE